MHLSIVFGQMVVITFIVHYELYFNIVHTEILNFTTNSRSLDNFKSVDMAYVTCLLSKLYLINIAKK